jgi:hypothetical protein
VNELIKLGLIDKHDVEKQDSKMPKPIKILYAWHFASFRYRCA